MSATKCEAHELADAFDKLELTDLQQQALKARYIAYIEWLERAATRSRRGHYAMRLTAATGGVIVTSMSSAEVLGDPPSVVRWILLATSLAVGVALVVDGLLTSENAGGTIAPQLRASRVRAGASSSAPSRIPTSATRTPRARSLPAWSISSTKRPAAT